MTEEEAVSLIEDQFGSNVRDKIGHFLKLVADENERQNLVSASTLSQLWTRHALDSVQLVRRAEARSGLWIDIGSGGGFPGIPVAIAREDAMLLVEPRRKRADFLSQAAETLGLSQRVRVKQAKMEKVVESGTILSARAVSGIEPLFEMAHQCASAATRWLLPRGRIASEEIDDLRQRWKFLFHVEQSDVSLDSQIAIFDGVRRL